MTKDLPMTGGRAVLALAAVAALVLTAACGSTVSDSSVAAAASAPTVLQAPAPDPDAVPAAPQDKPVLTLIGRIGATNADSALRIDRAELDRLGLLAMAVNDPWAKQRVQLQGVWLRDLVAVARPDAAATTLHLTALDDYQVDLKLDDVRASGVFLATRNVSGADLPVEDGGPTRVVFTDDLVNRVSPDLWIWNIKTIEVR